MDETVSISIREYEALQRNSRRLKAIRDTLDEYHIKKKLIASRASEDHIHRLRRITINKISDLVHGRV